MIRAAIITISDASWRGDREDLSGPAIRRRLEEEGYEIALLDVLPDEQKDISERLRSLSRKGGIDIILTTGGTGVAVRDVTPEATLAIIDKEIPGMAERMRQQGASATPFAVLSRAVAGTCLRTLIVNLPGSPKGAVESLDAILELVPHVVRLLHGQTGH